MSSRGLRPLSAVVLIFLFSIFSTAAVSANTNSKSVNTTTGECTGGGCGSLVYGTNVIGIHGTYDEVNRLCSEIAGKYGWASTSRPTPRRMRLAGSTR